MSNHDHSHSSAGQQHGCCADKPASSHAQGEHCHEPAAAPSCCPEDDHGHNRRRPDWLLWGSAFLVTIGYGLSLWQPVSLPGWLHHYSEGSFELMNAMWWGLALGIFFVGLLSRVPRETVMKLLGPGGSWSGLLRATGAGVLLDLCSHGILAVGAKLYERGASAGQMMAFLVASPWNSFSLTLIMFGLIGVGWTLAFIGLSLVVAVITGRIFDALVARGVLPANPASEHIQTEGAPSLGQLLREARYSHTGFARMMLDGVRGAQMVIRWALFGVVLASLIRAFVPAELFQEYFGPTVLGLLATVIAATIIEVCSEGSVPIAADLFNRAGAPGNAFTFLMAGVATDYTEVMVVKDTTRSWKLALFLPLVTVPQVLTLGLILNLAGA